MRFIFYCWLLIAAHAQAGQDEDFLGARDAFRGGDPVKFERYARQVKDDPLRLYISYYRLRLSLQNTDSEPVIGSSTNSRQASPGEAGITQAPNKLEASIVEFLSSKADTPLIDRLRGEWLKSLGKRQQWAAFDAEYPRLLKDDNELICYALQSRRRYEEQVALREVRRFWFTGKEQPESCKVLFEAAMSAGLINEQDIYQRLRLAMEASNVSLARQLAARLDGNYEVLVPALKSASEDADRHLERLKLDKDEEGQRAIAMFALQRLAKQSPDVALAQWTKISANFPRSDQQYFYGWLAYEAARSLDVRASGWFKSATGGVLNEQQAAWRVRAALRAQYWSEVLAAVNAMGEKQQRESTWRYWKARALQTLGKSAEAKGLFESIKDEYSFYGQLAGEELKDTAQHGIATNSRTNTAVPVFKPSEKELAVMLALPGVQRTIKLYGMGLSSEALDEWRWVVRNCNDHELLTAAEIARRNEMYDRAIGAADLTVSEHDFSLRYLAPYRDVLQAHIKENGLDEDWVYGLMRQESRFVTSAKSGVGASGLMQIMPSTARWVAKKLGLKNYRNSLIYQLDTNLRLGTYYMKNVLSQFDDSPVLASAAYNAGPGRARRWRGEKPLEGAIYAETIPFDETRDYVKKVMSNTMYYAKQFGSPPRSLKQRMGIIAAKTAENQQAIPNEP